MKKLLIPVLILALVAVAGVTLKTYAVDGQNGRESLISKIASRFNLKTDDVKKVFDEEQQARQAEMLKNFESKLDQLVKDGKITAAQKDLILKKHQELQAQHQSDATTKSPLTPTERKAQMDKERQDLEAWAKANNIDVKYLFFGGRKAGRGPGKDMFDSKSSQK